ncbi:YcaO-like family protein [Vibrio kyushuensis]|uniref:YcaO-like family protein n=1 Tax=Vibrio kyushuensis TaxID=2910249 RepID=UPI003D0E506E
MCTYPIEREFSGQQAVETMKLWLKEHNIHSSLYSTEDNLVATVELSSLTGSPLSSGSGKGSYAVTGAYFEAFEHMMLQHHFTSSHIQVVPLKEWLKSKKCHSQCLFGKTLAEYGNELLKFSSYHSLLSLENYLVPETLINPFYIETLQPNDAYLFLNKYTSNSGWASGSSYEEAVLHGANEVVERHCLSELYKQYIGYSDYSGGFYRVIPPWELLEKYQLSLPNVDELSFIMSTTLFGSHFCACVMHSAASPMAFRSSGVSYSEFHAVERALSELIQIIENYDAVELNDDIKASELLNKYDRLCKITDLSELDTLPLMDCSAMQQDSRDFKQHYENLVSSVKAKGYDLLVHTAFNQEKIWLTSTYIPGLERFNIIDKGKLVVPLGDM